MGTEQAEMPGNERGKQSSLKIPQNQSTLEVPHTALLQGLTFTTSKHSSDRKTYGKEKKSAEI